MSKLSDEITNDPLARGYSGMTDQQVADSLKAVSREVDRLVDLRELISYLLKNKRWVPIKSESESDALGVQGETTAFMVIMDNPNFDSLDLTDATTLTMLGAIKTAGLLNAADQTAIVAMGKELISRADELGIKFAPSDIGVERP